MADWLLADDTPVVDRAASHIHETAAAFLAPTLARIEPRDRKFLVETVEFDFIVGETICVATGAGDQIVYAQRPGRRGLSRFVKNRKPEPTNAVSVVLKKNDRGDGDYYVLITAWCGHAAEPEPWDRNATEKSVAFWNSHALVWGSEPTIPGTETTVCPW